MLWSLENAYDIKLALWNGSRRHQYLYGSGGRMLYLPYVFITREILAFDISIELGIYQSEHDNVTCWYSITDIVYNYYFSL